MSVSEKRIKVIQGGDPKQILVICFTVQFPKEARRERREHGPQVTTSTTVFSLDTYTAAGSRYGVHTEV